MPRIARIVPAALLALVSHAVAAQDPGDTGPRLDRSAVTIYLQEVKALAFPVD